MDHLNKGDLHDQTLILPLLTVSTRKILLYMHQCLMSFLGKIHWYTGSDTCFLTLTTLFGAG